MSSFALKPVASALLLVLTSVVSACSPETGTADKFSEADIETLSAEAAGAANALGKRLKGRLMAAMQSGGPMAAIEVCAEEAPGIAAEVSAETGFDVGRTALRVRNPDNAPDSWETEVLDYLIAETRSASDTPSGNAPMIRVTTEDGTFRWARAIPLEPACATCHGTNVGPEILAAISKRYPEDQATGFEVGDIRGIFTVTRN